MGPQTRRLFQQANAQGRIELFQSNRASEPGGARTDDRYLIIHDIARGFTHAMTPKIRWGWVSCPEKGRIVDHKRE